MAEQVCQTSGFGTGLRRKESGQVSGTGQGIGLRYFWNTLHSGSDQVQTHAGVAHSLPIQYYPACFLNTVF
jgi:hypothetical protein